MVTKVEMPCQKCGGSGWIPRYSHYDSGICFRCKGSGVVRVRVRADGSVVARKHQHRLPLAGLFTGAPPELRRCAVCGKEPPW